jgi:hypothetical protein
LESDRGRNEEDEADDLVASVTRTVRDRHFASLVLAAVVLSGVLVAAGRQAPDPRLTIIDFNAVGTDGQPVLDLSPKDVALKVGGRPREIKFFQLVRATDRELSSPPSTLPPPFATNVVSATDGRDVIVIIDEESIAPGKESVLRDGLRGFVSRLPPADRVTLVSARQGGANVNVGEGSADIGVAVGRFSAFSTSNVQNEPCRTMIALQTLRSMFNAYSGRYAPTVVLLSGGMAPPPAGGRGVVSMGTGKCALNLEQFHETGTAGRALQGNLYVLYAPELTAGGVPVDSSAIGLETLAGALAAQFTQVVRTAEALTRVARETSAHYLVGYEPETGERSTAPQLVELQVARERVRVRFRSETMAVRSTVGARKPIAPNDMLRVPDKYRDLPLRAAAFPSRAEDGKIRLVVVFETPEPGVKLARAAVGLYDANGRLTRWTADGPELARNPVTAGVIVTAGRYRMRVAAVDGAGRAGTVDAEVAAELTDARPVKLSGMVLGVADAQGGFTPRLQFAGDPGAFGYLEIYGVPKGAQLKVVQELAHSPDAPALISNDTPLTQGATDDMRIAYAGFAIDGLPVGDVVMRALVSVDGKQVARLVRTLRKGK